MKSILTLIIMVLISSFSIAQETNEEKLIKMNLDGTYQGKNIFVQNPFSPDGIGFCVQKVEVNGAEISSKIEASAFEIDLMSLGLKKGDEVNILIYHKSDCLPKVLNPNHSPKPTLKYKNVEIVPAE